MKNGPQEDVLAIFQMIITGTGCAVPAEAFTEATARQAAELLHTTLSKRISMRTLMHGQIQPVTFSAAVPCAISWSFILWLFCQDLIV
jgi:hypothetical protein